MFMECNLKSLRNKTYWKKYDWKENSFHMDIEVGLAEKTTKSVLIVAGEGETPSP
jgi:hypothetical protein